MPDTSIILPANTRTVSENDTNGQYEIDGLYPGYGHTLGNSIRRIILSSLPGSAITSVRIKDVNNEFSTIDGVKEDVITILLNLKNVRIAMYTDEPQTLSLKSKGEGEVTARSIETTGETEVLNGDHVIAHMTSKNAEIDMEIVVEKGLGFLSKEVLHKEKAEIGMINMDASFTPIRRVNYEVENMRVGERTDFNRLRLFIETDGTMTPRAALDTSLTIMVQQLEALREGTAGDTPSEVEIEGTVGNGFPAEQAEEAESNDDEADETEFLKTRIEDLDLSARTMNVLSNANIRTVGGLARKREDDLREIDGIGDKGIKEIRSQLQDHHVDLKE